MLWEMMVGCLEDGPKWCSILVSTTEVRTTLLFYIYGSWVKVRESEVRVGALKSELTWLSMNFCWTQDRRNSVSQS